MQAVAALAPEAPIRIGRVAPNGLAPVRNRDPAAAFLAAFLVDEVVGAPVLVDRARLGSKRMVAIVHLDGATLKGQRAVAVHPVVGDVARAVDAVIAAGRHGGVQVCGPVGVAFVVEVAPGAVDGGVWEVVFGGHLARAVGEAVDLDRHGGGTGMRAAILVGGGCQRRRRRCRGHGPAQCWEDGKRKDQRAIHLLLGAGPGLMGRKGT